MNDRTLKILATLSLPSITGLHAGQLTSSIEIPRLDVAEYHRPYVAAWIESEERQLVANLAVWYDTEMADREGETWLKDLRQWWRKGGRSLELPVDGVTGPTKPVGKHEMAIDLDQTAMAELPAGEYYFVVEASREVGGRELLRIPFQWTENPSAQGEVSGERELGKVTLHISE
ncbi:DUF2271 domain-containing protein [Pelagicoccus sp. SDUM812002]|uniref:DUF2271 domain-containing protein n=1 Tax=Pelagicoccus sp. SDUM812002 TaxID=3041266 RepID=UPI00280D29A5|nr:DUF2271 domain-containing protein [Pelagicoccus sp. SDUM812002]MDQ8185091.1 DUF2271 domain-containing protein [Pelagicoccus sp. SDUM812002]